MSREDMITVIKDLKEERETLIQEKECIIKHTKEIESELTSIKIKIANKLLEKLFNNEKPSKATQTEYFVLNTSFTRHSKTGQCHFNSS
jgi:uncharacterized protein Yka (UPF0111/DUF47 family)